MSFEEFLMAINDEKSLKILRGFQPENSIASIVHEHFLTLLRHYFIVGGLPEVVEVYRKNRTNLFTLF